MKSRMIITGAPPKRLGNPGRAIVFCPACWKSENPASLLVDCMTLWLSNWLCDHGAEAWQDEKAFSCFCSKPTAGVGDRDQ